MMSSPILGRASGFVLIFLALIVCFPEDSFAFVLAPKISSIERSGRTFPFESILARNAVETNQGATQEEKKEEASSRSESPLPPLKSTQETKVYDFLKQLSDSDLSFRIVVVGNGAILESTNQLGPTFKVGESPKTGASIVTFASEDQSFEFHLMPAQIASASLVSRPRPDGSTMRILRLLNTEGGSVCSLIIAEDSTKAQTWYENLTSEFGSEIPF